MFIRLLTLRGCVLRLRAAVTICLWDCVSVGPQWILFSMWGWDKVLAWYLIMLNSIPGAKEWRQHQACQAQGGNLWQEMRQHGYGGLAQYWNQIQSSFFNLFSQMHSVQYCYFSLPWKTLTIEFQVNSCRCYYADSYFAYCHCITIQNETDHSLFSPTIVCDCLCKCW